MIDFTTPQQRIGFDILTATDTVLTTFNVENTSAGTSTLFNFNIGNPEVFIGFFDMAGIDRITITGNLNPNPAIGINDLRFELVNAPAVPEPSTMLLLGSGLVGLIGYRMKKKA